MHRSRPSFVRGCQSQNTQKQRHTRHEHTETHLTYAHPPHKSATRDAGVNYRDVIRQLRLEHAVEVLAAADGAQSVAVGELGEDANLV